MTRRDGERDLLERMESADTTRRDFLKAVAVAAASVGLPFAAAVKMAEAAVAKVRPSVVWLHFQECTGCSESLLRTSHPDVAELILDLVSLDYHETLQAAAGVQAEEVLAEAVRRNEGKFVLVVEGSVPVKDDGVYCKVGGKTAYALLNELAPKAGAVVAIGSCASWGGIPSAEPNPTGATGVPQLLKGKPVVTLPGCPANPYNFLGTVLQYATFGTLPALDELGRPRSAYARVIHEDCPRRPHFDAGRFAPSFGSEGHRLGHCLYKLGCKGPVTHANCSLNPFNEVPGAWPVGIGHPCFGCTEKEVAFRVPLFDVAPIHVATPPDTYAPIQGGGGPSNVAAAVVVGAAAGALVTGLSLSSKAFSSKRRDQNPPGSAGRREGDRGGPSEDGKEREAP